MKPIALKSRIVFAVMPSILMVGFVGGLFAYYQIKINTINRAQRQVQNNLRAARETLRCEQDAMSKAFSLVGSAANAGLLKQTLGLDYFYIVDTSGLASTNNALVRRAFSGSAAVGMRIIDSSEICAMSQALFQQARIDLRQTPKARPTEKRILTSAMAMECARPLYDSIARAQRILYGGKLINRHFELIDRIHDIVYENQLYKSRPVGTVTIFLDDVRIATNVLTATGERAIGTRVSQAVYENVVERGKVWLDRAFVVTDWYLTAYEPIRDIQGKIIGILYVGILEQPFRDMIRNSSVVFAGILLAGTVIALIFSFICAGGVSGPLTRMVSAAGSIAEGDLSHRVNVNSSTAEIAKLAVSFNEMAEKLATREKSLKLTNDELAALNTRYLDLVSMVSHELKGILASTMLNAYSVRDGHLGIVNAEQARAIESIARNLEYFDLTVKNFLNLSRIEKNELVPQRADLRLKEDVIDTSIEAFSRQIEHKSMTIQNRVEAGIAILGDLSLLQMVANNLIGNAVKYGAEKGAIIISSRRDNTDVIVDCYNDGRPIPRQELGKLFNRFSRLDGAETRNARGTGLGLFLSRQIIEQHGGTLECFPREHGNSFVFTLKNLVIAESAIPEQRSIS
jgi:two-component system NtrC family sensor kinase